MPDPYNRSHIITSKKECCNYGHRNWQFDYAVDEDLIMLVCEDCECDDRINPRYFLLKKE